ncbi:PilN domain-containing protein [Humisphaera borealis]|uniref:PilN domain-containing protein n=1 Tax=Humisphaera borealis TaxID=2807512 RepID=A0A7M2WZ44_9BACT|nr:PilN domain-containing protein [Humisphaera borealis]QOV90121.1 PilN domain-containing protein [Humisphaera borealis]
MSSPNELSFLPEDYLERKARKRANLLCGALSIIVMGTIGSAFALSERSMRGLDNELADVESKYAQAASQIEAVKQMHAKQRQIVQHAELAAALVERVPRSNVLAEFTNSLPAGVSLLDLALEAKPKVNPTAQAATAFDRKATAAVATKKNAAPEAPKYDVYIKLTGVAENDIQVSQFITKLNRSKLLKEVNLVITDTFSKDKNNESTLRRFQLEMMINPAAEVQDAAAAAQ